MADLSINICGITSPNPFWLASGPPSNSGEQVMRAFDMGWGGAVWKTVGNPIVNVSSRLGAVGYAGSPVMGLNNIELITDRPLEVNFKEIYEVKKRYPDNAVVVSLMVESKDEWKDIIRRSEDTGADGLELNFGCPHGMCERGMGSAVGQEPDVLREITSWAREFATTPVIAKLTPNVTNILDPGIAAVEGGADAISLINTLKSIIGVDLKNLVIQPTVGIEGTQGGYCGPAVKPVALHMAGTLARDERITVPISGIGGISNWYDAAEFLALGSTSVQVCTAVMHYGYRIVEGMIDGLNNYLDEMGMKSVNDLIGRAVSTYVEWGDLDLNFGVNAKINSKTCIGCQLCYIACLDGGHQCIHTHQGPCSAFHGKADHGINPRTSIMPPVMHTDKNKSEAHIPFVDDDECIGCNLCQLVCPVPECVTMEEVPTAAGKESWNERLAKGLS
ncbi:MAG: NAD-dependent dihydropyrimidine dehydrogenase subunit PreA [Candidatus Marinimicrobia bacterium]|jgi:dihydropyrimidine dehydrogenase (NAD+) subunit PreA|nr:NAD-dependent dihydropyrimidine dehydrogenase subunit PreA [Candidatus Neomarinimicrobiota bacterium]MDP7025360.1 NAD-dependent dihydropyrimidine dehydrogenase subunit PreA [Candidatus Neomarinimicrobiota bacterium]|tara:strand:+ start:1045 stop:2385 length:1341 start_codon:yes stop_codon:yes gene_type:complete